MISHILATKDCHLQGVVIYKGWSFMDLRSFSKYLGYLYLIVGFLLIGVGLFVIAIIHNLFIGDLSIVLGIIFVILGIISLDECS